MKYGSLVIEKKEYVLLKRLMNLSTFYKDGTIRKSVDKLAAELETANVRDELEMPKDIVRLNSLVTISSEHGWKKSFQLVIPKENNVKQDKISIWKPIGAAVIGFAKGDTLTLHLSEGEQKLTIEKVTQQKNYINLDMVL